ncbi:MAG: NAD(P)H-dependent oxidoreductase [Spirochaetota bacterium]|nr:NAD(P)H-dependent oxidoreductase [Spirochaetota bacterium]
MLVLGLQGSPRKRGNTSLLLSTFMDEARRIGAQTLTIDVDKKNIQPCKEFQICEKDGYCPIDDDMASEIYFLLRQADLILLASPIFFYSVTAQIKALIDRSQTFWARKYRLGIDDPGRKWRRGFMFALGATKGENLFQGVNLTAKYFFDAVGADYLGSLTYRQIEKKGDITKHSSALSEAKSKANELVMPLVNRKKVIFICRENACRSQMASAFAQHYAGDRIDVMSGGSEPADRINGVMEEVMREKKIDMAFRKPKTIEEAVGDSNPDLAFTMGCEDACSVFPGTKIEDWDLPEPSGESIDFMRKIRDDVEGRILKLIEKL